ncbi:MAG TPA: hypothetical protein VJ885_18490 [Thermoanaerobaculia bacterium]|nr:hypothetical protein [Thermoanaerobaculia bacterium]
MKRVGLSRFRLALGRPGARTTPVRPSLLEPQGFRIRPRETPPAAVAVPPKNNPPAER